MRPRHPEGHLSQNAIRRSARAVLTAALAVGALGPAASSAFGQEVVEPTPWFQYQGGPGHPGFLPDGPQPPFRERWRLPAPAGESLSAPIVVGDQAVTVGDEAVYGVDLVAGRVEWEVPREGGPLSSPAAATVEGAIAVLYLEGPLEGEGGVSPSGSPPPTPTPTPTPTTASPTGATGEDETAASSSLVAIALEDQAELWRTPLEGLARSGVSVDATTAYVGEQGGRVVAVSLADGSVTWTAEVPGRVDTPVAAVEGSVYAVARDADAGQVAIVALDAASGAESWTVFPQATSTVGSAPAAGAGFVLVGSADRYVRSIAPADGTETWAALVLSFFSPVTAPAFSNDAAYAADLSGGLYRFDLEDGERVWSHQLNEVVLRSSPVISGQTVLLGLNDGRLVAIDAGSGHLVWESQASPGLVGTIAVGPDVVVAVKGGRQAGLIAFEPDPDGTLVDVPSPTELDATTSLTRYGVAAVVVLVVVLVPGILLRRRFGPADLSAGADLEDESDADEEGEAP